FQLEQMLLKSLRIEFAEELVLFHANAVLSGDGSPFGHADFENFVARKLGFFEITGYVRAEKNDRVQIAISRVEDIADGKAMLAGDFLNEAEDLGQAGSGHHAILHVIRGTHTADRTEGILAAFPKERPFGGIGGNPHTTRPRVEADGFD